MFVGVTFATGDAWWLGVALSALLADILVLVWLAMTSDTNGLIHDGPAAALERELSPPYDSVGACGGSS